MKTKRFIIIQNTSGLGLEWLIIDVANRQVLGSAREYERAVTYRRWFKDTQRKLR